MRIQPVFIALFTTLSVVTPVTSADKAIIWSQRAYSVDDQGQVVKTYEFLDEVDYESSQQINQVVLLTNGKQVERMHATHLLKFSDLEYLTQDNTDAFLAALRKLRKARELSRQDNHLAAAKVHEEILTALEATFQPLPPVYAWIMASGAYHRYFGGDKETAFRLLDGADTLLRQRSAERHLHVAEVRSLRGLLMLEEDQADKAVRLFDQAIVISKSTRGFENSDLVIYQQNLALAHEALGDLKNAIVARRSALETEKKIYPLAALELAKSEAYLGYLLVEAEQYQDSIVSNRSALGLYMLYHRVELLAIARIQYNIGLAHYHLEEFKPAVQAFRNIDFQLSKDASEADRVDMRQLNKDTLNYLGLIDHAQDRTEQSLQQFLKAAELIDTDTQELADGHIQYNVAGRYQDLGNDKEAAKWYSKAREIYRAVEGDEGENFLEVTEVLTKLSGLDMSSKVADKSAEMKSPVVDRSPGGAAQSPDQQTTFVNYSMHVKPHELMLVTKAPSSIMDGSTVLKIVAAGTQLWTLEQRDGWHRVVVPGTSRTAWISNNNMDNLMLLKINQLTTDLNRINTANAEIVKINEELKVKIPVALSTTNERGLAAAASLYEEILELFAKAGGEKTFIAGMVRSRLSQVYSMNGQLVRSRRLIEESLPRQRAAFGDTHPLVAEDLVRLANLLSAVGDLPGARSCVEEALQIATLRFGAADPRVIGLRMYRALILLSNGDLTQAEQDYRGIIGDEQNLPAGDVTPFAAAHLGLGKIAAAQRKPDLAIELFTQAAEEYSQLGPNYTTSQAAALLQLSSVQVLNSAIDEARATLDRVQTLVPTDPKQAQAYEYEIRMYRSLVEARSGEWDKSLQLVDAVLQQGLEAYGEEDSYQMKTWYAMRGRLLALLDRKQEAVVEFDRSRQTGHSYIVNTLADQDVGRQIQFLKSNDAGILHAALSLGTAESVPASIGEQTATWLLNSKNLAGELAARDSQIRKVLKTESDLKNYEQWLDSRKRIAVLPNLTAEEKADQQLDQTEAELTKRADNAFQGLPAEARREIGSSLNAWVLCEEVRQKLKPDEVFVDILKMKKEYGLSADGTRAQYYDGVESYVAWIIPAEGKGDVRVIDLGDAAAIERDTVQPLLAEIGRSLAKMTLMSEEAAVADFRKLAQKVADVIWKPIARQLNDDVRQITLCPDSQLWKVPFAALPLDGDRFLVEDYTIRFVSSGRDLLKDNVRLAGLTQPVIMADPAYDAAAREISIPAELNSLRSFSYQRDSNFDVKPLRDALPDNIARLTGTAQEANAIQPHLATYSGMDSRMLLRTEASEAAFRTVQRPHTLFIGTHGFFFPEVETATDENYDMLSATVMSNNTDNAMSNPLRRCGLLLAGCSDGNQGNPETGIDGILTGEEVVAQDLRGTELVVLSACETGIGDLNNGQGVAGLRQAIQLAGAKSVVSTLWSIEDQATSELITDFFKNLAEGKTKSQALRSAQISRIETRRRRYGVAHPFYWAAFTLTGQ